MRKIAFLLLFVISCILATRMSAQDDGIVNSPQVMPQFQYGTSLSHWLQANVSYPAEAMERGEQGRVMLEFVVEKDGHPSSFRILQSVSPLLDAEALRVAKNLPPFKPGRVDGNPCRVRYVLPVSFRLEDDSAPQSGRRTENRCFLMEGGSVAGISVGMLISQIPENVDGLYDSKYISNAAGCLTVKLCDGGTKVMDVMSCGIDIERGVITAIYVYTGKITHANGIRVGTSIADMASVYEVTSWTATSDGECCAPMPADELGTLYTSDLSGAVERIEISRVKPE